jgi:hypothetical protein
MVYVTRGRNRYSGFLSKGLPKRLTLFLDLLIWGCYPFELKQEIERRGNRVDVEPVLPREGMGSCSFRDGGSRAEKR